MVSKKTLKSSKAKKKTLEAEVQLEESIKAYQLDASFSAPHRVVNEGDGLGGLPYFIRENLENYVGSLWRRILRICNHFRFGYAT